MAALAVGKAPALVHAWIGTLMATTYTRAGYAREQVCTWMCPWPRLQGAIWRPEALIVSCHDDRGSARKAADDGDPRPQSGCGDAL